MKSIRRTILHATSRILVVLSSLIVQGCAGEERNHSADGQYYVDNRRLQEVFWDTISDVGGELNDTTIIMPQVIAADSGVLYVYDAGDAKLKAFGSAGQPLWTFGRRGEGPNEFANVIDMELGPDASIWLLDGGTNRVMVVQKDGSTSRLIRLGDVRTRDVIPSTSTPILLTVASEHFLVVIDSAGAAIRHGEPPTAEIRRANAFVRQTLASNAPAGGDEAEPVWSTIFPFGHLLLVYDGERMRCSGRLIEGSTFPEAVDGGSIVSGLGMAMTDSAIYVLARGQTVNARRMIDVYSPSDCRYEESLLLPGEFSLMTFSHGVFYLYSSTPFPRVLGLRPRAQDE